ncbi:MAG: PAS domain S-box protein [Hydrogenophilales bacterium]|nr:PAS domain S-box protein [Hydrogenophilales bacterium]
MPNRLLSVSLRLPLAIGALALLLGVTVLWNKLQHYDEQQQGWQVDTESQWLQKHFEAALLERVNALDRMAHRWEAAGGTPKALWRQDAASYVRDLPGFQAIAWADALGRVRWVAPEAGNEPIIGLDLKQGPAPKRALERAHGTDPIFSAQINLTQDEQGLLLVHALSVAGRPGGYLLGVFRTDSLFANLTKEIAARGYGLDVSRAGVTLYRRGELPAASPAARLMRSFRLDSGDGDWQIRLWPTPAHLSANDSVLPELVLASGLALTLLAGITFWLWGLSAQRARQFEQANRALRYNENLLEHTGEIANIGGWELDLPDKALRWTPQARRIHELAQDKQPGLEDALGYFTPEARPIITNAIQGAIERGSPFDLELPLVTARGRNIWVRAMGHPQFENGKLARLAGALQDITAHKQAELQLRLAATVFENSREGVTITDAGRNIISVNRAFTEITGYAPREVIGKNPRILQSGRHDAAFYQAMWAAIREKGHWSGVVWNKRKNGEIYPEILNVTEVRDAHGLPLHYIGVFTDITERKQAEEALIAAKDEAERANLAKSQFLSSMSHELRTPMNAMLGFAQLMETDQALSPDNQDNVGEILKAGQHLLKLINEILNLEKVESGSITLSLEPVDLCAVVNECLALIHPLADARGIWVESDDCANIVLRADRMRVKQVLLNLLSNAVKYNRAGGSIKLHFSAGDGQPARILVSDTGPGIPQARLGQLFQPFNRLGAENGAIEGAGIGLAISRKLVELMGGAIGVESPPGEGSTFWRSTFWFDLPQETMQVEKQPARQSVIEKQSVEDDSIA